MSASAPVQRLADVSRASRLPPRSTKILPVAAPLTDLLPDGGLRRGTTVRVSGVGATSLVLALTADATREGAWVAVAGAPAIGPPAAHEMGVALDRLVLVPHPGSRAPTVLAALVEAFDIVVTGCAVRAPDARRLGARSRERGCVLVALAEWPEGCDVRLLASGARWEGLGLGFGRLEARTLVVTASGRGAAGRERRGVLRLPGLDAPLERVEAEPAVVRPAVV